MEKTLLSIVGFGFESEMWRSELRKQKMLYGFGYRNVARARVRRGVYSDVQFFCIPWPRSLEVSRHEICSHHCVRRYFRDDPPDVSKR